MARVGVITTSYPRTAGDPAGCFVEASARWLQSRGYIVDVIAAGDGCSDPEPGRFKAAVRVQGAGSLFYRGGAPEALTGARGLATHAGEAIRFSLAQARAARRRLAGCDVVVAHWLLPSLASALAVPGSPRIVAIAHSGDVDLAIRLRLCAPLAIAALRPRVDLVFVSEPLRRRFLAALPAALAARIAANSRVCPMGCEPPTAATPTHPGRVLFLGRLVDIKGVDVLIDACAAADTRELIIAGDGPARAALTERARVRDVDARFVGTVTGRAKDELLSSADVIALPSREHRGRTEGMPVVALEALSTASRIVVSDTGGLADLPREFVTHVPPGDAAALTRALTANTPQSPDVLARRHAYAAQFSWDAVGPRLFASALAAC